MSGRLPLAPFLIIVMDCSPDCVSVECVELQRVMQQVLPQILQPNITGTGFWSSLNKIRDIILTCTALSWCILCAGIRIRLLQTKDIIIVEYVDVGTFARLNDVNVNVGAL